MSVSSLTTTSLGASRGYIQPDRLTELWFHTGTTCNLRCPFCLEGSKPGDTRIQALNFDDAKPFIDEALLLGVEQFSFTGGEPFVVPDFPRILSYALEQRPCLVLSNGTEPLLNQWDVLPPLLEKPFRLKIRVSLDYPDPARHDAGRGRGNFARALECLGRLHQAGFEVSIARQREKAEDVAAADQAFAPFLASVGLPVTTRIVSFPDFLSPGQVARVPEITEDCMTRYHSPESRAAFMCAYSKFVLKKNGRMRVYACTLVDDDDSYDLGDTLRESLRARILMRHHRCYSCFAHGASCSER
jgi:MoaA/NifB/PqqE/SkfB family radical SAM enzyme